MQTLVPYGAFAASARSLDSKRLGKQRVEVIQIENAAGTQIETVRLSRGRQQGRTSHRGLQAGTPTSGWRS